jgi:hypothetical protein
VSDFHCRHEGEIESLKSQNADQYERISKIEVALGKLEQVIIGNGVEGLTESVPKIRAEIHSLRTEMSIAISEVKKEVEDMRREELNEDSIRAAVAAAVGEKIEVSKNKLGLAAQVAVTIAAIAGSIGAIVAIFLK